jgi:hypothetical protein
MAFGRAQAQCQCRIVRRRRDQYSVRLDAGLEWLTLSFRICSCRNRILTASNLHLHCKQASSNGLLQSEMLLSRSEAELQA